MNIFILLYNLILPLFLCTQNMVTTKTQDWIPRRIKYKTFCLNLPLEANVFFHFLKLTLPRSVPFQTHYPQQVGIYTGWELNIESNPLICSTNKKSIMSIDF